MVGRLGTASARAQPIRRMHRAFHLAIVQIANAAVIARRLMHITVSFRDTRGTAR